MTPKINSNCSVKEINSVSKTILKILESWQDELPDSFLTLQKSKIETYRRRLTKATKSSLKCTSLIECDEERGNALRALFYEVKSKIHWPDDQICKAAYTVKELLDNYGVDILQLPYHMESSNIKTLLQDLKNDHIMEAASYLPGFHILIDNLSLAQRNFDLTYGECFSQDIEFDAELPATKLSEIIKEQLNKELFIYIKTMSQAQPEEYNGIYNQIQALVSSTNTTIKKRIRTSVKREVNSSVH